MEHGCLRLMSACVMRLVVGRAREIARCKYCSSEHHSTSSECVYAPEVFGLGQSSSISSRNKITEANASTGLANLRCSGGHPVSTCYQGREQKSPTSRSEKDITLDLNTYLLSCYLYRVLLMLCYMSLPMDMTTHTIGALLKHCMLMISYDNYIV